MSLWKLDPCFGDKIDPSLNPVVAFYHVLLPCKILKKKVFSLLVYTVGKSPINMVFPLIRSDNVIEWFYSSSFLWLNDWSCHMCGRGPNHSLHFTNYFSFSLFNHRWQMKMYSFCWDVWCGLQQVKIRVCEVN